MELSFGMIFSIILIIAFISFAGYVTVKFLNFQSDVKIKQFQQSLQSSVNDIWLSEQGKNTIGYPLPTSVERVCFFDKDSDGKGKDEALYNLFFGLSVKENLMFYPEGSGEGESGIKIDNLDLKNTTAAENPLCIDNKDGKVTMTLKMDYGEKLVKVSR